MQDGVGREIAVVGADPIHVLAAGVVGARLVLQRVGSSPHLWHPEHRDRSPREAARTRRQWRHPQRVEPGVDHVHGAAAQDQRDPTPRLPERLCGVVEPTEPAVLVVGAVGVPVRIHLGEEP